MKEDIDKPRSLFDMRAEVLAASILQQIEKEFEKPSVEQIIIVPKGSERRRGNAEVTAVNRNEKYRETVFNIEVSRKGFYDTLPEGLFLRLDDEYLEPLKRSIIKSHNLTQAQLNSYRYITALARTIAVEQQISDARKFFLPFEQALYWPRVDTEQLEQLWTESFPDFIADIWRIKEFDDCLDTRQKLLLGYLLPLSHQIAGNMTLTQLCFEQLLGQPITLDFVDPMKHDSSDSFEGVGHLTLGVDFITGNSFCDNSPALRVGIYQIAEVDLKLYLPGGKVRRLLDELLYQYFLPFDLDVDTEINVSDISVGFCLGQSVVGYTTILLNLS